MRTLKKTEGVSQSVRNALTALTALAARGSLHRHKGRARTRAMAGWITLANALGLLVLFFNGPAAHAQSTAYPRANAQPAMQAASPQAPVPAANYQSALAGLALGVESQSTDWRNANDTVGQFKRGHIDLLKLENDQPSQPRSQP